MASAFRQAVQAGRRAWRAGVMAPQDFACASTPVGNEPVLLGGAS
jgi:thiazole synthase